MGQSSSPRATPTAATKHHDKKFKYSILTQILKCFNKRNYQRCCPYSMRYSPRVAFRIIEKSPSNTLPVWVLALYSDGRY